MDATGIAKLITVLCLVALFVAAVLITPRIWHSNERPQPSEEEKGSAGRGDRGA